MAFTDGFKLVKEVENFRSDDVPHLLKAIQLTSQSNAIQKWFIDQESRNQILFIQKAVHAYCYILTSAKLMLARAFIKVLLRLPNTYQIVIEKETRASFEGLICKASEEDNHLRTLCLMLDQNKTAKKACHELISPISHIVKVRLDDVDSHKKYLKEDFDTIYYTLKMCILCLQLNPEPIRHALHYSATDVNTNPNSELSHLWHDILARLLSLLLQGILNRDLLFLVGTAVAMEINLLPSHDDTVAAYVGVISMLISDQSMITIGNMSICKPSDSSKDVTLSLLSVIKGLLVSASSDLLCHPVKKQSLLLLVFPRIMSVCQGTSEYHYLAFQFLLLWFEKLVSIGVRDLIQNSPLIDPEANLSKKMEFSSSFNEKGDLDLTEQMCIKSESQLSDGSNEQRKTPRELESLLQRGLSCPSDSDATADVDKYSTISLPLSSDYLFVPKLMSKSCPVLSSTLSCLWLNWDSPVDGVSDYAVNIFKCVMKVWSQSILDGSSDYSEMSFILMNRVMSLAWHSKTRYPPMSVLLSHVNSGDILAHFPNLKDELMKCMALNYMANVATDVYNIFIQSIKVEFDVDNQLSVWSQTWMDTLLYGLTSSNALQRLKTCTYWLPPTLKIIPGSTDILLQSIALKYEGEHDTNKNKWLFAWITVFKFARDLLNRDLPLQHDSFVQEAITSYDETVRSEVLVLICGTMKRSEPVSQSEIRWMKLFLPGNLRTDSAVLRQCLTSSMKKFIVRIRDSCIMAVRTGRTSETFLSSGIEFIDWLSKLLMHSLTPGGSYQRRKTTLNLLEALLESLIYLTGDLSKKGKAPKTCKFLLEFAKRNDVWDFFSGSNFFILLSCLEDGAEEIQTQSYNILMNFFRWPTSLNVSANEMLQQASGSVQANTETICHLFTKALELMSSPKSYENHSGLLIMDLILKNFVKVLRVKFCYDELLSDISSLKITLKEVNDEDANTPSFLFINIFVQMLQASMEAVKKDVAKKFKGHSIHGITECLTKCTEDICKDYDNNLTTGSVKLLEDIVLINQDIILLMLDVLTGGKTMGECPSFADMGIALEGLVSSEADDQEEIATLSPDFQLLLSWCWNNLKSSCSCLSEIVSYSMRGSICLLPPQMIKDIGGLFVKVFTTCRHRGAIEGCRSGFSKFTSALLSSKIGELFNIPKRILEEILQSLSTNSLTASVSRRSAGLPVIVQTIVSNETRICANKESLMATVESLYAIASEPLPANHSQQKDLAQSHALNVLKVIFHEASLSSHLMPLMSKITILVIEGFNSPSWVIRNAATQLIGTLVTRIFGQKNMEQSSMTLEELNSAFPDLHDFAHRRLEMYSSFKSLINPSLYLVLTLFSNLAMSSSHHDEKEGIRKPLQQITLSFASSPLYSLRKLSAQAYVSLCLLDRTDDCVREILGRLSEDSPNLNTQHGYLLCVYNLVSTGCVSDSICLHLLDYLSTNHYLDEKLERCSFTAATVMMILDTMLDQLKESLDKLIALRLWSQLTTHILFLCKTKPWKQLGNINAMNKALQTLRVLTLTHQTLHSQTMQFLCSLSVSDVEDVRHSFLICVSPRESNCLLEDHSIQKAVMRNISQETSPSVFIKSCQLLTWLQLQACCHSQLAWRCDISDLNTEDISNRLGNTDSVKTALFLLEGIIIRNTSVSHLHSKFHVISRCCQNLLKFSNPCMNEDLRLSTARFLRIAGKAVLDYAYTCHDDIPVPIEEAVVSLIRSLLCLLQDSEPEIRTETAIFISEMKLSPTVHADLAWKLLSDVISEHLWWNTALITTLMHILFAEKELTSALQCSMATTRDQRLFQPETESKLSESYTLKLWSFQTLENLLKHEKMKSSSFLTSACLIASADLNSNLPHLMENTHGNCFFNVTSNPSVLSALMGLIFIDKLCSCSNTDIRQEHHELHSQVQNLQKISNIHPFLKDPIFSM